MRPEHKTDFIKRANIKHTNTYDYSFVNYINNNEPVIIICNKHGPFKKTPTSHLNSGCPECLPVINNKASTRWLNYISKTEGIYIQHAELGKFDIKQYKVDGYCPQTNTCYIYHDCFLNGCVQCYPDRQAINLINKQLMRNLYENMIMREENMKSLQYKIVTIWKHEWKQIEKQLDLI